MAGPAASPAAQARASKKDELFLRRAALRTWRYFAEFSNEQHNWLIPDNVQEEPAAVVARVSPTNLGFLLNARQVACEFGYLTAPEFVAADSPNARHHGPHAALPRTSAELVRHAHAARLGASLRFQRG